MTDATITITITPEMARDLLRRFKQEGIVAEEPTLFRPSDTITFTLIGDHGITNKTVRMRTNVDALVQGRSEAEVTKAIHAALRKLVDVEWFLNNISRSEVAGTERVTLQATARVKSSENHNLRARAEEASEAGLVVGMPVVDHTFPLKEMEEARAELREELIERANEERQDLCTATGRDYRLGSITFSEEPQFASKTGRQTSNSLSAYATVAASEADDDPGLGHSEKIVMYAVVELRADDVAEA